MSFLGPIPLAILAYVGAGAALLTIAAYIIKTRRRRFEVPFSYLWRRVLEQKDSNALWQRLKRLLSLFLLLFILGLVLFAAMSPTLGVTSHQARNVVVLLDASASMKATDGDGPAPDHGKHTTRMEVARKKAKELIDSMGGGDVAMVMRMDGQTTPLGRFSSDGPMLDKLIDGVTATDTPADLHRALGAAADALRDRQNPLIVIISDGAFPSDQLAQARWTAPRPGEPPDLASVDLTGMDVRYVPIGARKDNVGIVAFNVRRYVANKAAYEVFIEVENFGDAPTQRTISLFDGDLELFPDQDRTLDLAPGQRVRRIYPNLPTGLTGHLKAQLSVPKGLAPDPFPLDDTAYALLPTRKKLKVLLVTKDNLYLEGAVLVYDNIEPDKVTPAEFAAHPGNATRYDAIIFDDYTPPELPPVDAIYFHPDPATSPVAIARDLEDPHITDIDDAHPVMKWVTLSDAHFDETHVFAPDKGKGEQSLAAMAGDSVVVAKRDGGHKYLVLGFPLGGTDLTLRVAFPLLLVNTLDWFAGDDADLITTYATGVRQRVPIDAPAGTREAQLTAPDGTSTTATPVVDGLATFYADTVGVWHLAPPAGGAPMDLAANLANPAESTIAPAPADAFALGGKKLEAPEAFAISRNQELWIYFLIAAVLLLSLEWITYHRRITV